MTVDINGLRTTTDAAGGFTVQTLPIVAPLSFSGAGIVPRGLTLSASASRTVNPDAIALDGRFDLNFYRQIVRNTFDAPAALQPLRRWTRNPLVYLRTVDDAGTAIDAKTLDSADATIREAVPMWTSGALTVTITRGIETRQGSAGWITVTWLANPTNLNACGQASVGREGGTVDLNYRLGGGCRCAGVSEIRPRTIRHEIGHAMGFWHTDSTGDLMSGVAVAGCDQQPSARELYHAAIAYKRPVGNTDPDVDPSSAVNLAPMKVY